MGEPDSDEPAPVVNVQGEPVADHGGGPAHDEGPDSSEQAASPTPTSTGPAAGGPLAVAGLVAGLLGLGLGGAAFARAGRS